MLAADGKEPKRLTDIESKTPFSPINLWLYRQTYFGIRDVLGPLVREGTACVMPMQEPGVGKTRLFEACPASTLKRMDLYRPYKGGGEELKTSRIRILDDVAHLTSMVISQEARRKAADDREGDALDSILALLATARASARGPASPERPQQFYWVEGFVYQ